MCESVYEGQREKRRRGGREVLKMRQMVKTDESR